MSVNASLDAAVIMRSGMYPVAACTVVSATHYSNLKHALVCKAEHTAAVSRYAVQFQYSLVRPTHRGHVCMYCPIQNTYEMALHCSDML